MTKKNGTVYVLIGIPGAGKSTWIDSQGFDTNQLSIVSMDSIREELTGDVSDQTQNQLVAKLANDRYKQSLSLKVPVVIWDATSVLRKYRSPLIELAHKAGYEVVGVHFDIPLDVSKQRNAGRDRVVPEHVLDRMNKQLQSNLPSQAEGFDVIQTVRA